jgi:hypothetical protein
MRIQTKNGYTIDFPHGLEARPEAAMNAPYRGDTMAVPFVIRGEPGLINACFRLRNVNDKAQDFYIEHFTAVLRPAGWLTNFRGREDELRGELTVPKRLFPVEIVGVEVENLSARNAGKA